MKEKIKLFFNYKQQLHCLNMDNKRKNVYNAWIILSHIKDGLIFEECEKSAYEKCMIILNSFHFFILSAVFLIFISLTHSFFIESMGDVCFYVSISVLSVAIISGLYTGLLYLFKHEEESVVSETYLIELNKNNLLNSIERKENIPKKAIKRL